MNFLGKPLSAQVVSTIEIVPETLFFTPPGRCWIRIKLRMNDVAIGEGSIESFLPEEILQLNKIVMAAVERHRLHLKDHGNL